MVADREWHEQPVSWNRPFDTKVRHRAHAYTSGSIVYTVGMSRRTTLQVDDELLAQAQAALGTSGLKDTVETAFRQAIRRALRERLADRIATGDGVDRSAHMLDDSRPPR